MKTFRVQAFAPVCLLLWPLVAQADQITMKDGDRITGAIVKKEGDTLTFKSKNFGEVKIRWSEVASVTADEPLTVVLPNGEAVKGVLRAEEGQLQINARRINPAEISAIRNDAEQRSYERLLNPGLLDLWTVSGSINIAGTKGNAETSTLTTPFNMVRATRTSRTTAYFNSIRSTASVGGVQSQTARAVRGGWGYNRNATKRIFLNAFNDYEYDKFQSLDLRVVLGGGAGYQFLKTERGQLSFTTGVAWDRESFGAAATTPAFVRQSAEGYGGDEFAWKINSRTTLTESFRIFTNLSDLNRYRINFDTVASTQIMKWLTWNIGLSDRYLNVPAPGRGKNDFLYSAGFGFSFAR